MKQQYGDKENIVIAQAVNVIDKLLTKYKCNTFDIDHISDVCDELFINGTKWYEAYRDYCYMQDYLLCYPCGIRKQTTMDSSDISMASCENDEEFINFMGLSMLLSQRLKEKNHKLSNAALELSSKSRVIESDCEIILDSYRVAGVSPYILTEFVRAQHPDYNNKREEIIKLEKQIDALDRRGFEYDVDSKKLDKAICTLEQKTYLRYYKPGTNEEYIRYNYDKNIKQFMINVNRKTNNGNKKIG